MKRLFPKVYKWCRAKLDSIALVTLLLIWFAILEPITKQVSKMKIFKDMDDNQFWLTLWTFLLTSLIAIVTVGVISSFNEDILVHDLVTKGHNPFELSCLYNLGHHNESLCFVLMQAKAKEIVTE